MAIAQSHKASTNDSHLTTSSNSNKQPSSAQMMQNPAMTASFTISMFHCTSKQTGFSMYILYHSASVPHIRTLFGNSQISTGTELWVVLISGIGQGNGVRPQIWAVVSTPILDMLWDAGFGASFKLAISGNQVSFVGYSFVDDTNLVQTGLLLTSLGLNVIP